jgi:exodeoxyribonuclease VII large subunit
VDHLEEAGVGRLMREFEALKRSLAAQGLFDPAHKQAIPRAAQRIGIVTSPTGAALRDALSVIRRKSPGSEVTLFATAVQGEQAAQGIVDAIELANRDASCEVILLIRGGGSLEDLWCFNQETVARAIFESKIPVVCGVGHEIDTTIADLVADARAPTPSVAAESVTLDQYEQMARIDQLALRLRQTWGRRLDSAAQALANAQRRLSNMHPERQLAALHQRLDFSRKTLRQIPLQRISAMQQQQRLLHNRLIAQNPTQQVDALNNQLEKRALQMRQVMQQCLQTERHALALATSRLDDLSPLRTLARGYAIVSDPQGSVIRSAAALEPGDQVDLRFEDGVRQAQIRDAEAG